MLYPEIVIAGCGNPLFADDGFGPAVVEEMQKLTLPDNVAIIDAGLGGPHFIFTLLDPEKTRKLVISEMKQALPLSVPVEVEAGIGKNWLEAHS